MSAHFDPFVLVRADAGTSAMQAIAMQTAHTSLPPCPKPPFPPPPTIPPEPCLFLQIQDGPLAGIEAMQSTIGEYTVDDDEPTKQKVQSLCTAMSLC